MAHYGINMGGGSTFSRALNIVVSNLNGLLTLVGKLTKGQKAESRMLPKHKFNFTLSRLNVLLLGLSEHHYPWDITWTASKNLARDKVKGIFFN